MQRTFTFALIAEIITLSFSSLPLCVFHYLHRFCNALQFRTGYKVLSRGQIYSVEEFKDLVESLSLHPHQGLGGPEAKPKSIRHNCKSVIDPGWRHHRAPYTHTHLGKFWVVSSPISMLLALNWRKLENLCDTHANTKKTCKTQHRQKPKLGIKPFSCKAAMPAAPPCHPIYFIQHNHIRQEES